MATTELAQPLHLCRILVADGVVMDRWISIHSSLEHAADRPAFGIVGSLRTSVQIQVDAMFRDQKKSMDVFVDQGCFLGSPERDSGHIQHVLGQLA